MSTPVAPINLGYYREKSNSFVVICRISAPTKGREIASMCDILIELNQIKNSNLSKIFITEQWIMIKSNQLNQLNQSNNNQTSNFPPHFLEFSSECFSLFWYTKYCEKQNELQFRILMEKDFQQKMTGKKCILYPWKIMYESFMNNYIEIRFSPTEKPLTDTFAEELRKKVEWEYVSMEMTHIFRHNNNIRNNPTYYVVTDMTDGNYRWYVWKTSEKIQSFLNETLRSISYQFDSYNYNLPDPFAQISSMILTKKAHNSYSIDQLKRILTVSDKIKYQTVGGIQKIIGKGEWTAKIHPWHKDIINPKRIYKICHNITINNINIKSQIQSFIIKNNPSARTITRIAPILPENDPISISPHFFPETHHMTLSFPASAEESEDDVPSTNSICHHSENEPIYLQIKGGPEIISILNGKLNFVPIWDDYNEIFKVPRRDSTLPLLKKQKQHKKQQLVSNVINQIDPPNIINQQFNIIYISLYHGNNHINILYYIMVILFFIIFILTCIGFGFIIIEQMQIKKRSSSIMSNNLISNNKGLITPPKKIKKFR